MRAADTTEQRRARESQRVEERALLVETCQEFDAALSLAEDKLVIVEAFSLNECDLGENTDAWSPTWNDATEASQAMMEPCSRLHSTISRVARECSDISFVHIDATDSSAELNALKAELGIQTLPTVQFWKSNKMLYQIKGASGAGLAVGEGALYFGDQGAGGEHASNFVEEVKNAMDVRDFIERCDLPGEGARGVTLDVPCEKQLAVLTVSNEKNSPNCMHVFPAIVALAKNTQGAIRWARLLADSSDSATAVAKDLNITEVPTFVLYFEGKEVGRVTTSDRAKLMEYIIMTQQHHGFTLPQPPPRKRMSIAEAKELAKKKREQDKRRGW